MIISGFEANQMHFKNPLLTEKAKWAFLITLCYIILFLFQKKMYKTLESPQ